VRQAPQAVFEIAADDLFDTPGQNDDLKPQKPGNIAERKISSVEENIQIQIEDDYLLSNVHHNINNTTTKGASSIVTRRRDAGLLMSTPSKQSSDSKALNDGHELDDSPVVYQDEAINDEEHFDQNYFSRFFGKEKYRSNTAAFKPMMPPLKTGDNSKKPFTSPVRELPLTQSVAIQKKLA